MRLLDRTGFVADRYERIGEGEIPSGVPVLVPFGRIEEALAHPGLEKPGVEIGTGTAFADIAELLGKVSLVSIAVGGFTDGRCFSLAKRIRRSGFSGRIRLTGPLIADQFAYALACGVDEIALPGDSALRQPESQWVEVAAQVTHTYQRGYLRGGNILEQRRLARKAAIHG